MGKRKGRLEPSKTLNTAAAEEEEVEHENGIAEGKGFFACYLLVSLNPRFKGHTYIGFTVNPRRRIRQHNGEIRCGAWRTKWKRPWEMVLCIYGFPTNVAALQFEWAWQHPVESLAVRKAAASFKSLSGVANKIKIAYTMLTLPSWQSMNITVNFFSTQYMKHCAGCPSLPEHMKVQIGSMDELPCYTETVDGLSENDDDCIDEEEHQNNSSNNTSVPVGLFDSMVSDSAENSSQIDNNNEAFRWTNREYEVRKPCDSVTSQDQLGLFGSIKLLTRKSSKVFNDSDKAREIMEEDRDIISANKSGDELCQSAHKQSCITSSVDINEELSSKFIVPPPEAEIIDLCTPSPNCRSFAESKKRRIRSDFIDLTMSPNFVQL